MVGERFQVLREFLLRLRRQIVEILDNDPLVELDRLEPVDDVVGIVRVDPVVLVFDRLVLLGFAAELQSEPRVRRDRGALSRGPRRHVPRSVSVGIPPSHGKIHLRQVPVGLTGHRDRLIVVQIPLAKRRLALLGAAVEDDVLPTLQASLEIVIGSALYVSL